tara:strand:- start:165 stop:311 length:147 start_codon:yes stop_codon:yes gene_type:complete
MLLSGNRIRGSFGNCGSCYSYDMSDSFGNYGMNCSSGLVELACQIAIC